MYSTSSARKHFARYIPFYNSNGRGRLDFLSLVVGFSRVVSMFRLQSSVAVHAIGAIAPGDIREGKARNFASTVTIGFCHIIHSSRYLEVASVVAFIRRRYGRRYVRSREIWSIRKYLFWEVIGAKQSLDS